MLKSCVLSLVVWLAQSAVPPPAPQPQTAPPPPADALLLQVVLDRAGFSPGAIDGRMGQNTQKALTLFQQKGNQIPPSK